MKLKLFFLTLFSAVLLINLHCTAQSPVFAKDEVYESSKFHFTLKIPSEWNYEESGNDSSNIKLTIQNKIDSTQIIFVYAYKTKGEIDLEKLADSDTMLFGNLGNLKENKTHFKLLIFFLSNITKTYETEKMQTKLLFKSQANFGYVVIWRGLNKDSTKFIEVSESLETKVPFGESTSIWIVSTFKDIGGWILGIIGLIIFLLIAYGLGQIGLLVRKNIRIVKHINSLIANRANKNEIETLAKVRMKCKLKNILVFSLLVIFYYFIFSFTTATLFLLSLLILVPVIMGYFGYFFTPSEDADDYF